MSVENLEVIDVLSIDLSGNTVLTISDHLEWNRNNEHIMTLQNKINAYLGVIENGSLYKKHPNAKKRNVVINIAAKYRPNKEGKVFLERTKEILESAGYGFSFSIVH